MAWGVPSWLGGSSSPSQPESVRPRSKDGGYVAPDRTAREHCYESRDAFFQCLDKNNILDAIKEDEKSRQLCPAEVTAYERDCARSWIKYFKEKRVMDYKRDQTLQRIQQEDAQAAAAAKKKKGWLG